MLIAEVPFSFIEPAIVTLPLARITTGVFVVFFVNVTVTPLGILTVVKLKIPLGGNCSVVFTVGLNAPSASVLPLSNANTGEITKLAAINDITSAFLLTLYRFITHLLK